MERPCDEPNCTVADTGVCILNNDAVTCPRRRGEPEASDTPDVTAEAAALEPPTTVANFPLSLTLTPADARDLMAERYCHLVGILGIPDSGKTAALVSLFLLLSGAKLKGFKFADSRSLMAFNEISQGARHWSETGEVPEELTVHTLLADDRSAGFLHLRLRDDSGGLPLDLLLPDLPGEWSTALMDHSRSDRLSFFTRADAVWVMIDGRQLAAPATRKWTTHRAKLLLQRLADIVTAGTPVSLVVTHRDEAELHDESVNSIIDEGTTFGLRMEVSAIASFANPGPIKPGTGIAELVARLRTDAPVPQPLWPDDNEEVTRAMLRFRRPEARA